MSASPQTNRVLTLEHAAADAEDLMNMQRLMSQLLFSQLAVLRLFDEAHGSTTAWKQQVRFPALYDRWLDEAVRVLADDGYVTAANGRCTIGERSVPDRAALWSDWEIRKSEWLTKANVSARVRLVDATLRGLPQILTGTLPATDVLFPKSSMELVEGIYKRNAVADYFNAIVADSVVHFMEAARRRDPSARIRIIEIGAGTGGTSEGIFERLRAHHDCIAEYCYTDVSKAFLMHAEQAYGPTAPYLTYRIFDVERPLAPQGVEIGGYDLAVAANVLHATKNIRHTLRNAKAVLKKSGVLLLNEVIGPSLFAHLTFGLLEGWWLYDDVALRIPGTPTLAPETWQRVLQAEGFQSIRFPALASHVHGQQIVVAESDGVIRQSHGKELEPGNRAQSVSKEPKVTVRAGDVSHTRTGDVDLEWLRDRATVSLKKIVGATLKLPLNQIDSSEALEKYGLDSILVVKMVDALRHVFAGVTSTLFFEYRTLDALVDHFIASEKDAVMRWVGAAEPTPGHAPASADPDTRNLNSPTMPNHSGRRRQRGRSGPLVASESRSEGAEAAATHSLDVAIIGLSGRYPEAVDIDAFWSNLREGKDCIVEVPKERWDWREYFSEDRSKSGHHYSKWGGFIAGVDEFDPVFFGIAPKEAKQIDPQERLFLQHAWMAMEDAGYTRATLHPPSAPDLPGQVGVYVGVMYSEYQLFGVESSLQGNRTAIHGSMASIANRVSYVLDLHGPSLTLDTMCSSSLTAIHVAAQDLKLGRTSLAIAGGVNVSIHPNKYLLLSAGQFLSGDGRCQSFGEGGDGFIPAEGVGVVILKRLAEAKRDGDHVYGIIRGSALTHGGKTNGYTVPNPQAQASTIHRALVESDTDPRHISYIEAHGTGTKLGDPIEIAALSKAFQHYTQDTEFCSIGSVKSNIGHCESAAGIAALTKVLLQMQHQQLVPSLHAAQLNPHIEFSQTPFVVNQSLRTWQQPVIDGRKLPRIAGISSFGAGGSNAHLIVEEYQAPVQQSSTVAKVILPLSARTAEQLQQKARDLLDFVRVRSATIDLGVMAHTLQVGREAMDERVGFVVSSVDQLAERLEAYVAGEQGIEDTYRGQVKRHKEALSMFSTDVDLQHTIDKWIDDKKLSKLLDLWVKGLELNWGRLYGEAMPARMSLPTYPFAKERYWVDTAASGPVAARHATSTVLHPMVHSHASDPSEQRYRSTFTGEEFFLIDHVAAANGEAGRKVLPDVAYLEMARAAIEHAFPAWRDSAVLELRDTVWTEPIVVTPMTLVNIALMANDEDEIDYEIYSRGTEREIVHCQGRAVLSRQTAPAAVDLEELERQMGQGKLEPDSVYAACARTGRVHGPALRMTKVYRGSSQLLAHLRLPSAIEDSSADYVLHPSLMEGALQTCVGLIDGSSERADQRRLPMGVESLRIVSPCTPEMVAWVRYTPGGQAADAVVKLDIDLCDERGNVAVQMRGVSWQLTSVDVVAPIVAVASPAVAAALEDIAEPLRKEIVFISHAPAAVEPLARKKAPAISLAVPSASVSTASVTSERPVRQPSAGRPAITLPQVSPGVPVPPSVPPGVSAVRLYDDGHGIFCIHVAAPGSDATEPRDIIAHVQQALHRVQQEASLRVLILRGLEGVLRGDREAYSEAVEQRLHQALVSFPHPVIAVLQGDAIGVSLLAAALCDFIVCNEDAFYGYMDARTHFYPTRAEAMVLSERFGEMGARDLLYLSAPLSGKQLRARGWTCPILPEAEVEAHARKLASTLATKSQSALRLLKQHLTRHLSGLVAGLTRFETAEPATEDPSDTVGKEIVSPTRHIHLDTPAENVLLIKLRDLDDVGVKELAADLGQVFAQIRQSASCKAIVLASEDRDFLPATEHAVPENVVFEFQRLIVDSEIPVVAALDGNATGHAWLIGQFCDACVYSRTGVYSTAQMGESPALVQTAAASFPHRFGNDAGNEILLTGADYRGVELQQRVGALIVAERDDVLPEAVKLAELWAGLPRATLASWKQHAATTLQEKIRSMPVGSEQEAEMPNVRLDGPTSIALKSQVVTATAHPEGVVVVTMEDRQAKNMFSDAFMEGIAEAFAHIEQTPCYKVVVLTGYDSYFASGGTKESLLAIQQGKARFTDFKIFQLPLDCKLPVIAAMQGHGIGGGWTLGMFADVVLLSEESRYGSPYMDYGFTPGAGATWILAEKMGHDLARESLLTAQPFAGRDLRDRGLTVRVLPRLEVYPAAMALAARIAQGSRSRLIRLKQQLTGSARGPLEETYRLELAMHDETFVGQSDTLAQIHSNFYGEIEAAPAGAQPAHARPARPSVDRNVLPAVTATLKTLLADELQMRESDVAEDVQFVDLGLDSISGVTWVRKINEKYHTTIEATKIYSYPTLTQLSRYVREEAEKHGALSAAGAPRAAETPVASGDHSRPAVEALPSRRRRGASRRISSVPAPQPSQTIAVIGMAGQFPQARNLEEFWQNIAEGKNCISQIPPHRWDVNAYYQPGEATAGKTNSQWAGVLEEYDRFDPLFFNISPTEAEFMDPQQRLFLQACWHSIENAAYDARVLSGSRCAVFVGCATGDYHQLSRKHQLSAQGFTGNAASILSARIAYFLNLQGPCVSVDTACSSSLVALAQACDSLNSRESDVALAGGVYVMAGPEMHIRTAQAGMLSPRGRCFTFDQRADGFVPGEGVGVVMLKRLTDAQRDQDIIHGIIEGWGINQDGRTNGITAPNPESQTRLEQDVYDKYQIDPASLQLIEAHGTATKLGDPIEIEGLKAAFKKYTAKQGYCALGSVKSNVGHCLTAAGIASVIKLLLALKHKQLPPTIHFEQLNEHIELTGSPFYVNTRLQEWELNGAPRRRAATSSFGFSGTNAHIVIGEYPPPAEVKRAVSVLSPNTKAIIPLSARTTEQLRQKAVDLMGFIRDAGRSADLIQIAYTLQVGRAAMDERLGFVVSSVEQLADRLQAYVDGRHGLEDVYQGHVKRNNEALSLFSTDADVQETIGKWIASKRLAKLLDLWVKGLELDWNELYGDVKPQRMDLPLYPFAKECYWIDAAAIQDSAAPARPTPILLHPLLHRNASDLTEQRFRSTFTGEEFFLADHQIATNGHAGYNVLPPVAHLEMARAAIEHAWPARLEAAVLELHNTVWAQPIVGSDNKHVSIALSADDRGEIDYEIYTHERGQEIVHCQGRAVSSRDPAPAAIDLEALERQMADGKLEPDSVYAAHARMGVIYGPALQGITAIHRGSRQLLAQLRLPDSIANGSSDYFLHPTLMDGALQAAVALIDMRAEAGQPRLPFALDTLRIVSPCTAAMAAWVRYAPGSQAGTGVVELDVDLCDERGNVCVQMRGLSSRLLNGEIVATPAQSQAIGSFLAIPVWHPSPADASAGRSPVEYSEHHVLLCELSSVDVERLGSSLPQSRCLSLQAGQEKSIAQRYTEYALACFERIQTILRSKPQGRVLVQIVVAEHQEHAVLAGLSALLKTAALENLDLSGQLILTTPDITTEELTKCLQDEKTRELDPQIRYEQGARQVLRWEEIPEDHEPPIAFREGGVYLISGGLGGLGILFAREILQQARHATVVLTGRSPFGAEIQARLDTLSRQAGRLSYRQVDLGDLDQVKRLVAGIRQEHQQLDGILHAAGMMADNIILKKSATEFREVLEPKVIGTFNLDQASRDVELDFFVLFSSVAGALGNPGQADYATANGFMDRFAAYRNQLAAAKQRYGRTRSINWSLWQAGGMRIDSASQELVQQTTGVQPMQTATGLRAFHRSLALPYGQTLVVEGIREKITTHLQRARIFEFPATAEDASPDRHPDADLEATVSVNQLQRQLKTLLATVLRIDPSVIDADQPFGEFGLDSFLGAELMVAINKKYGTELSHIRLFDYSTLREFSLFLEQEIKTLPIVSAKRPTPPGGSPAPLASSFPVLEKTVRAGRRTTGNHAHMGDRIAIIGMSGRYPSADDLDQYWTNLAEGRNSIVEVPPSRWDVGRYYDPDRTRKDKTYSRWLGAVDDVDCFDPLFFRISPQEAEFMDPQHRLFLQESYRAFEDAGYSTVTLSNKKCGVYLGISTNDYMSLLSRNGVQSAPVTSNSYAIAAARIAYYLNLKGPAISVDTACSSSLVSIHLASQALLSGEIDMALAGGVSLWLTPDSYVAMSQAGMFSQVGQCKTFDDTADGIVNGEGVGAVVLKRLKDAQKDGDVIYGVILGSGINQDGRTSGITAPSVNSQIELERSIYSRYEIDPETITYVEAHGTGTRLGDPIELEALATVFNERTTRRNFCALGSVKSNIGHTTAAAGVAGLQKVLLSMRYRTLVPSLNVTKENSRFDFQNSPFYISRETKDWDVPPGLLRRAAVSSFGFSGTNAHLVIEEYPSPAEPAVPHSRNEPFIVPLSARTPEQLRQKARDLLEFIRTAHEPIDLGAAAYTLQIGREPMEERLGFVVSSIEQLAEKLRAYGSGEKGIDGAHHGRVDPDSESMTIIGHDDDMQQAIDRWIARKKLPALLDLWIRGLELDWNKLYRDGKPHRVSLPTYPFARERCWIDEPTHGPRSDNRIIGEADMKSIEAIINEIADDTIETGHAVRALRMLV